MEEWGRLIVLGVIVVGFLLVLFAVALWEKERLHNWDAYRWRPIEVPPYLKAMRDAIDAAGFDSMPLKHRRYAMHAAMAFSPDRRTLVHSGAGKVAGMDARQTWLYSRLRDGRIVVTTDDFDAGDQSGIVRMQRVINGTLEELLAKHRQALEEPFADATPFREATPMEAQAGILCERAEAMVSRGRARWTDEDRTAWRHTVVGALCIYGHMARQFLFGLTRIWRVSRRRPGD